MAWFVQSYMGPMTNFLNLEVIMKLWRASLTIHNISVSYQFNGIYSILVEYFRLMQIRSGFSIQQFKLLCMK